MRIKFISLFSLMFFFCNDIALGQFWEGVLYGVGQAVQNYNNQVRQNNNHSYSKDELSYDAILRELSNERRSSSSKNTNEFEKKRQIENDGFEWFQLETKKKYLSSIKEWITGEPYGAMSVDGKTIVPRRYDEIYYRVDDDEDLNCKGYFLVEEDGKEGVYSKNGSCLISTTRGYTSIYKMSSSGRIHFRIEKGDFAGICDANGKEIIAPIYDNVVYLEEYYSVKKNGYEGACNISGREIIAPNTYEDILYSGGEFKYKNSAGEWISLNIDINGNPTTVQKDIVTATNNNSDDELLYKGTYTISNQGYCAELGGYTDAFGADITMEIEIYEDYILVGRNRFNYLKTSGIWRIYGVPSIEYYRVNPETFAMNKLSSMDNPFTGGTNTWTYAMVKGQTTINKYSNSNSNVNNGIGTIGGNNNTSTSGHTSTQKTKVRKNCAYCGGKGETIQHESVATFGLDGPRVYCNKCNQSWSHGTVHAHHFCNHCNGRGYVEYEY